MSGKRYEPTYDELESLFVNNPNLALIDRHLGRFNPIKVMKMEGMEIRHSAILAWLLDPAESHGLGDGFLKAFLMEALRGYAHRVEPNALDISQADLRDADVRREWHNIDIFVLSPQNRWAFLVENKVYSTQGEGQLNIYREKIEELYQFHEPGAQLPVKIVGIFLTLSGEIAADPTYVQLGYADVHRTLQTILTGGGHLFETEIEIFLKHYIQILEELMGSSSERSEMEGLARKLYRDHKRVIDFIIEHGSGSDFTLAIHRLFDKDPVFGNVFEIGQNRFHYTGLNSRSLGFLPKNWVSSLGGFGRVWPGCENWWAGLPVICWVELHEHGDGKKGQLKLCAELGPLLDREQRTKIIENIQSQNSEGKLKIAFRNGALGESAKFSRFFNKNTRSLEDVQDSDEIFRAVSTLIGAFSDEFAAVAQALGNSVN